MDHNILEFAKFGFAMSFYMMLYIMLYILHIYYASTIISSFQSTRYLR